VAAAASSATRECHCHCPARRAFRTLRAQGQRTAQAIRTAQRRRGDCHNAVQALPHVVELGGDLLLLAQHHLQVVVGLLALEVQDAPVQRVDLVLGALADGTLGLAVVCPFARKLLGREVGDASGRRRSAALLGRRLRGTSIGMVGWAVVGRAVGVPGHLVTGPDWGEVLVVVKQESCGA
jgi:hypothetical protein